MTKVWLATTVHDPAGRMLAGIERNAEGLADAFGGVAVAGTDETDDRVFNSIAAARPMVCSRHRAGADRIGAARRESLALALEWGAEVVLYSDLDHLLRWIEHDAHELSACLAAAPETEVLVVGPSDAAFAASPARLRQTESLVNHVYTLMTGRRWDLMFALRRLSARAASAIVANCHEDGLANDVTWPLLAERLGFSVGYFSSDGLRYLTTTDFDKETDQRDGDPRGWIHRIEIAAGHCPGDGRLSGVIGIGHPPPDVRPKRPPSASGGDAEHAVGGRCVSVAVHDDRHGAGQASLRAVAVPAPSASEALDACSVDGSYDSGSVRSA